jgi:hypothetical protein
LVEQPLFVYDSKTLKARRQVPISPRVRNALLARYAGQKEGWFFRPSGPTAAT